MIKDFEEYKVYRSRYLSEGISAEESAKLRQEMDIFAKNHPKIFNKMNENKWSEKGVEWIRPDGTVAIMK